MMLPEFGGGAAVYPALWQKGGWRRFDPEQGFCENLIREIEDSCEHHA
jgi:hypothetical protein